MANNSLHSSCFIILFVYLFTVSHIHDDTFDPVHRNKDSIMLFILIIHIVNAFQTRGTTGMPFEGPAVRSNNSLSHTK